MATLPPVTAAKRTDMAPTLPVMGGVFLSFLAIGMALPVLPLDVHDVLGFWADRLRRGGGGTVHRRARHPLLSEQPGGSLRSQARCGVGLALMIAGGLFYLL